MREGFASSSYNSDAFSLLKPHFYELLWFSVQVILASKPGNWTSLFVLALPTKPVCEVLLLVCSVFVLELTPYQHNPMGGSLCYLYLFRA